MTKDIKWRLKEQPTTDSLRGLVADKLLTPDEARQILFSTETKEEKKVEDLEAEIKFLRQMVDNLSKNNPTVVVKEIQRINTPYWQSAAWTQPYTVYCNAVSTGTTTTLSSLGSLTGASNNYIATGSNA